jgi:hypothetical protein
MLKKAVTDYMLMNEIGCVLIKYFIKTGERADLTHRLYFLIPDLEQL